VKGGAVKRWSPTGMAAFCRQPDAKHPGKREKTPVRESLLSLPAFSRFDCARVCSVRFLKFHA